MDYVKDLLVPIINIHILLFITPLYYIYFINEKRNYPDWGETQAVRELVYQK